MLDTVLEKENTSIICINHFPPSVPIWQRLAKLSILILEGTIQKIYCYVPKNDEKKEFRR